MKQNDDRQKRVCSRETGLLAQQLFADSTTSYSLRARSLYYYHQPTGGNTSHSKASQPATNSGHSKRLASCPHCCWAETRISQSMRQRGEGEPDCSVWYGILEFNVPLNTVQVISETTTLSSDEQLPFSNGGPAT